MKISVYKYPAKNKWASLCKRPTINRSDVLSKTQAIINEVIVDGDIALKKYNLKFDGFKSGSLEVSQEEIKEAHQLTEQKLKQSIASAAKNIKKFHVSQNVKEPKVKIAEGIDCWREARAIEKVGLYIPGGSAPLFSTVLMLGIPAMIAGCKEVVLCTPAIANGKIHPAILYAATLCNIKKIYKVGGAQAIAAMAYGTKTIPSVYKIFGPGNQYVTAAKQLVQNKVAIDMPAGPSEVLVIGDETAVPTYIAADLLAQAEHGPDSQVIFVTTALDSIELIQKDITLQLAQLPRKEIALQALQHARFILVKTVEEAVAFSNEYAPEHLILSCKVNNQLLNSISNAGSVFIGNYSPESAGDYASGTNHTLPTNGYAAMHSGVSLDSFYKKITFQKLTKKGLEKLAPTIVTMANGEGLQAHSNAVTLRLKSL